MITMASVEAQNGFGNLLDKAQRQMVSVTRRGRAVALVMSPEESAISRTADQDQHPYGARQCPEDDGQWSQEVR